MLIPLFDKDANLAAWLDDTRDYLFNTDMEWIAFLKNDHIFSAKDATWLGPIRGTVCMDTRGRVMLWGQGARISGMGTPACPARPARPSAPARPARPATPPRPARPATPLYGWSPLYFRDWLVG